MTATLFGKRLCRALPCAAAVYVSALVGLLPGPEMGQCFQFPVVTCSFLPRSKGRVHGLPCHPSPCLGQEMSKAVYIATASAVLGEAGLGLNPGSHSLPEGLGQIINPSELQFPLLENGRDGPF